LELLDKSGDMFSPWTKLEQGMNNDDVGSKTFDKFLISLKANLSQRADNPKIASKYIADLQTNQQTMMNGI
jgi:hypothetical protein